MSRISNTFAALKAQGKKALIPYITAGDPNPALTLPLLHGLVEAGVDMIELGIPFSDPMADGPVIQRASERALAHGVRLKDVLGMVTEFRKQNQTTPIVLMGYANPIEAMGYEQFIKMAQAAGVDGVLTVDYPPEECQEFVALLLAHGIDPVFLLAPTSNAERVASVIKSASGFVYYVSLKGVTGASHLDIEEVGRKVAAIRTQTNLPIGVGFGVRDAATAKAVAAIADAVVIGSRTVQTIESSTPENVVENVKQLMREIRAAV
jgi:tryptophan synthase alpha chain